MKSVKKNLSKPLVMWLVAALCCLLWGSAFPSIKAGYALFEINPADTSTIILFAGIRFFLAGVLTIIIFSAVNKKVLLPRKSSLKKIGVLSLFQTVIQYIFFYLGLAFTTGERGSVINGTSVFFMLIISSLIFKIERLTLNKVVGCVIGFLGVILVSLDIFNTSATLSFKGELFILFSSISYAFSSVFMKRYSENDNPAMLSGWQFVLGGAVMIAVALIFGGRLTTITARGVALLLYLAFLSALAYSLWSILLKYNDVSRVAVCSFMTPVFGFILSALLSPSSSSVGLLAVASLILVVSGIIIVNKQLHK